jgi:cyclopropane fatty-acyl-phospholipid synthase-like methyltransferase
MSSESSAIAWLYDEMKHIGVNFDDPAVVALYDAKQRSDIEDDRKNALEWGIGADHTVIEFGPGTGAFTVAAAERAARVIAVDVSAPMLEYARRRAIAAKVDHRIEFRHAGFLTYQHAREPADFVVSEFAFHHLPDFWKAIALDRIFAMLKPGGRFILRDVVFSFPPEQYIPQVERWIDGVCSDTNSGWSRGDFEMHVRDEHSTFSWILESMLRRAGFEVEQSEHASPT